MTALTGCAPSSAETDDGRLRVVATTTIVGDVVRQVAGDLVDLTVLLPVGTDPHTFDPRPQDVAAVADAQVIFASGLGLEEFLEPLLDNAGSQALVVRVSDGVTARGLTGMAGGEGQAHETGADPHVWMDPNNVLVWTENVAQALSAADPAHAGQYAANAAAYESQLQELDSWIREQVAQIPAENRKLVTDHMVFGYFAERYGFEQVGAIIPGFSTGSTPSAQELAAIEDAIREYGVRAVLTGKTVNPALAERVAEDTGVKLVPIYTGSLSAADGPADTYLNFMDYNVSAIVEALK
ncbi:MAG: zinc ABC transporter substrate-binding protein [Chloroflexi bacterium]|nr:zinc ABC transporter substrate-binding protein [Chloroflexota bacterium]